MQEPLLELIRQGAHRSLAGQAGGAPRSSPRTIRFAPADSGSLDPRAAPPVPAAARPASCGGGELRWRLLERTVIRAAAHRSVACGARARRRCARPTHPLLAPDLRAEDGLELGRASGAAGIDARFALPSSSSTATRNSCAASPVAAPKARRGRWRAGSAPSPRGGAGRCDPEKPRPAARRARRVHGGAGRCRRRRARELRNCSTLRCTRSRAPRSREMARPVVAAQDLQRGCGCPGRVPRRRGRSRSRSDRSAASSAASSRRREPAPRAACAPAAGAGRSEAISRPSGVIRPCGVDRLESRQQIAGLRQHRGRRRVEPGRRPASALPHSARSSASGARSASGFPAACAGHRPVAHPRSTIGSTFPAPSARRDPHADRQRHARCARLPGGSSPCSDRSASVAPARNRSPPITPGSSGSSRRYWSRAPLRRTVRRARLSAASCSGAASSP